MRRYIEEYTKVFFACFILLCLLNFLFRSLFSVFNLIVLLALIFCLMVIKNKLIIVARKIKEIKISYVFIAAGIISAISILLFNPVLFNDPLALSNQALNDLQQGFISLGDPYSKRNLFYLIPVYGLLGSHPLIIKLVNAFIYMYTGFLFYRIICLNFCDNKIVQNMGIILFFAIPYFYLALNIPHYDLISTLYLMISLYVWSIIMQRIKNNNKNLAKNILLSIALGISFVPLFYTRGLTIVMLITSLIYSFILILKPSYTFRAKLKIVSFVVIIPFMIYFSTDTILRNSNFIDASVTDRSFMQMVFAYNDTRFDGTTEHHDKKWVYFPLLPQDLRTEYAIKKLNSEINYNWQWYLFRLSSKSQELYSIGGLNEWIIHDSRLHKEITFIITILEFIFQLAIAIFAIVGLIRFICYEDKNNLFLLFTLLFIFICSSFALFSEVRNRYSLIFIYGLIIFAALGFDTILNDYKSTVSSLKSILFNLVLTGSIILVCFFGYRQFFANKHSFEQLQGNVWKKEIGNVNLSAFQKQLNKNVKIVELKNSRQNQRLSFFLRTEKNDIENIRLTVSDGVRKQELKIKEEKFNELRSHPDLSVAFIELDISDFTHLNLILDFSDSEFSKPAIIEYLSLYNKKEKANNMVLKLFLF